MKSHANTSPLACNPDALAPEQRQKHAADTLQLFRQASKVVELPNGLTLQFPNEPAALRLAAEFVADEARCCPFLHFNIHLEPENGLLAVSLTGPEGARELLKGEFSGLLRDEQHGAI